MYCGGIKDYPDFVCFVAADDCKMGQIPGSGTEFGSFFV